MTPEDRVKLDQIHADLKNVWISVWFFGFVNLSGLGLISASLLVS